MNDSEHDAPPPDLVTVFSARDATVLPVVEGLLREAGIPFWAKREGLQDLFSWGRVGAGYSFIVGPVEILVHPADEAMASELLDGLELAIEGSLPDELA